MFIHNSFRHIFLYALHLAGVQVALERQTYSTFEGAGSVEVCVMIQVPGFPQTQPFNLMVSTQDGSASEHGVWWVRGCGSHPVIIAWPCPWVACSFIVLLVSKLHLLKNNYSVYAYTLARQKCWKGGDYSI